MPPALLHHWLRSIFFSGSIRVFLVFVEQKILFADFGKVAGTTTTGSSVSDRKSSAILHLQDEEPDADIEPSTAAGVNVSHFPS